MIEGKAVRQKTMAQAAKTIAAAESADRELGVAIETNHATSGVRPATRQGE